MGVRVTAGTRREGRKGWIRDHSGRPTVISSSVVFILSSTMAQLQKIGDNIVKKAGTGENVKMSDFWSEGGCVLFFMRRFG